MFQLTWGLTFFYLLTIIQGAIHNAAIGGADNFKTGIKNAQEFTTPLSVVTESTKIVNEGLLNKEAAQLKIQAKCTLATSKLLSVMSSKPQQTETATKAPNWRDMINSWKCSKQEKVQQTRWTITDYILLILLTVSVLLIMYGYYLDEIYYWQLWERNILKERSSFKKKNRSPSETETASSSDMEGF